MNIVITGASRGIGFETVLELGKNESNHIIALSRNKKALDNLNKEFSKRNNLGKLTINQFDITDISENEMYSFFQNFNAIDVLINNAGLLINKPFTELSYSDWFNIFNVNLFGLAKFIKFILPWLEKSKQAHIVNIGSMGGFQGSSKFPGLSAYSSSKAALANLTECLAEEFKSKNIAVNCLALGAVQTEMLEQAFPGYRAPVTSKQIAQFIAEFSQNMQSLMNGKIIPVALNTP